MSRIICVEYEIYAFDNLSEKSKDIAMKIDIRERCERNYEHYSPKMKKAARIAEKNQTPWFFAEIYFHDCGGKKEIENSFTRDKTMFLENGEIFNIRHGKIISGEENNDRRRKSRD